MAPAAAWRLGERQWQWCEGHPGGGGTAAGVWHRKRNIACICAACIWRMREHGANINGDIS
jgi:hypothetical protein